MPIASYGDHRIYYCQFYLTIFAKRDDIVKVEAVFAICEDPGVPVING
jgi:hypothetical protein